MRSLDKSRMERAQAQRRQQRRVFLDNEIDRHAHLARKSPAYMIGRDRDGAATETKHFSKFSIIVDRWYVRLGLKRNDRKKLEGESYKNIEERIKGWTLPSKLIKFDTHLIIAIRALQHIQDGYRKELERTDEFLKPLDELNFFIGCAKKHPSDKNLDRAILQLKQFRDVELKRADAAPKLVAKARLSETIKRLEKARALPPGGKRRYVAGDACAMFTSARNRLSLWRDEEIAGHMANTHQKECSLRIERDKWLLSQFSRFCDSPETIFSYCVKDAEKLETLSSIRKMLRSAKDQILAYIAEKSRLFRVKGRKREDAEQWIDLAEADIQPKIGAKIDYQIGRYAKLYRSVREGKLDAARKTIGFLELFVHANKPGFILEELGKNPDPYLKDTIAALAKAVAAFDAQDFAAAKTYFTHARDLMSVIVYPKAVQ